MKPAGQSTTSTSLRCIQINDKEEPPVKPKSFVPRFIPELAERLFSDETEPIEQETTTEEVDPNALRLITFKCPERRLDAIHELVRIKRYPSRSELIRTAIKNLLDREL